MNIITIFVLVISVGFFLIQPSLSANDTNWTNDVLENHGTLNEPNGVRFQRILHRKKRFLIFPPGSAIVVCVYCKNIGNFFKTSFGTIFIFFSLHRQQFRIQRR